MTYLSAATVNDTVHVWERESPTHRVVKKYPAPAYCYIDDPNGEAVTMYGTKVRRIEFESTRALRAYKAANENSNVERRSMGRKTIRLWESDIQPHLKVLSQLYYQAEASSPNITFWDIEVDYDPKRGFSSVSSPYAPISAIALHHYWSNQTVVLCVPPPGQDWTSETLLQRAGDVVPLPKDMNITIHVCGSEQELILLFLKEIKHTDILSGWNSDLFDTPYTAKRIIHHFGDPMLRQMTFPGAPKPYLKEEVIFRFNQHVAPPTSEDDEDDEEEEQSAMTAEKLVLEGRISVDYMRLVKKYEPGERPSYALEPVSAEVLVDRDKKPLLPKLEYSGSLHALYHRDFAYFIRYNIRDCEILKGFEDKLKYVGLANTMCHISCGLFDHVLGTIKLAELAIINYCHYELNRVVNDFAKSEIDRQIAGAFVLAPQVGMHSWVCSLDINSLYPSAIRSVNISPETLRGQFEETNEASAVIAARSNRALTAKMEDGQKLTMTACEWIDYCAERKWAVSGYGTIFDQSEPGIIPNILTGWFSTRKHHQSLKKAAEKLVAQFEKEFEDLTLMPSDIKIEYEKQRALASYHDRLQYVYKIKLNSLYGSLTNLYFRFYRIEMGESTTATGRMILKHQCRQVNTLMGGEYDVDFPLYLDKTAKNVREKFSVSDADKICLNGTTFKGQYQSEHIIYGDTDSVYFKLRNVNTAEEAVARADALVEPVNASFQPFMKNTFLCTEGYDNLIKAAREVVSDNGIFVEKKRYILHLIDKEGKKCDEIKVMGLDTKKTTIPKVVSEKLNGFIEMLLIGKSWDDVSREIVAYKEVLLASEDIRDIGLPKGVKKVEHYAREHQYDAKTRLPGHVAASLYYNKQREIHEDHESIEIMSNMKIKVFWLRKPDGRFKAIALPTDTEIVPPWFLNEIVVDRQAQITRLVDKPLANILKAIGKTPPNKHTLLMDDCWEF